MINAVDISFYLKYHEEQYYPAPNCRGGVKFPFLRKSRHPFNFIIRHVCKSVTSKGPTAFKDLEKFI